MGPIDLGRSIGARGVPRRRLIAGRACRSVVYVVLGWTAHASGLNVPSVQLTSILLHCSMWALENSGVCEMVMLSFHLQYIHAVLRIPGFGTIGSATIARIQQSGE